MQNNQGIMVEKYVLSIPNYMNKLTDGNYHVAYNIKGEEKTQFNIFTVTSGEQNIIDVEMDKYDTKVIINEKTKEVDNLKVTIDNIVAENGGQVFHIILAKFEGSPNRPILYVMLESPDTCRNNYSSDVDEIINSVHMLTDNEIYIDFTSTDYKGEQYKDVVKCLKEKGFSNVKVNNLQDIIFGIVVQSGSVETVTINGENNYTKGMWIDNQAEVTINYHGKQ